MSNNSLDTIVGMVNQGAPIATVGVSTKKVVVDAGNLPYLFYRNQLQQNMLRKTLLVSRVGSVFDLQVGDVLYYPSVNSSGNVAGSSSFTQNNFA